MDLKDEAHPLWIALWFILIALVMMLGQYMGWGRGLWF